LENNFEEGGILSDRELLELAAKAAGFDDARYEDWSGMDVRHGFDCAIWSDKAYSENGTGSWNPLRDDGDALRLAVKLGRHTGPNTAAREAMVFAWARDRGGRAEYILVGADPYAATRRAIVRAAAGVGRAMP
jgi:hypothetical protein